MQLIRLVATRVGWAALTLFLVSVLVFIMVDLLPGDAANASLGRFASEDQLETFRAREGLNDPAFERYGRWIGQVAHGDLGDSIVGSLPVWQILGPRLANTLALAALSMAIFLPLVVVIAAIQAARRERPVDHALSFVTLVVFSIPDFFLGTVLLLLFALAIPILPAISHVDSDTALPAYLRALVLPALTIALVMTVHTVRMLRDNLIEVLESEYVRMATLKGLRPWRVLFVHAFPNALVPSLNIVALNFAYLIGGVVVVERIYAFPGMGSLLVDAVKNLDYPVILATTLIASVFYVAANLVADIVTIIVNPRLRNP